MSKFNDMELLGRIKAAAGRDLSDRPVVTRADEVPWAVEAISVEWLDACLGSGAGREKITSATVDDASSGTSVRGSIRLERDGNGNNEYLFAKTYPEFEHRVANILSDTAQAEGHFYLDVLPHLNIEAPKGCYWAWDEENYRAVVIIEDVAHTKGASFCDWKTSISRDEAEDAVRLLARVHAKYYKIPDIMETFPWIKTFETWTDSFNDLRGQHLQAMIVAEDIIPEQLHGKGEELYDQFMSLRIPQDQNRSTLIHSDVHLGNWYKTSEGRMGLCDWQCCNWGPAVRDLSYAVSSMLEPDDRRSWEAFLVHCYMEEFAVHSGFELEVEQVFLEYRRFLLAALMMWTPTLCPAPNFPVMQPEEMSRKMIERITAAIAEQDSLGAF